TRFSRDGVQTCALPISCVRARIMPCPLGIPLECRPGEVARSDGGYALLRDQIGAPVQIRSSDFANGAVSAESNRPQVVSNHTYRSEERRVGIERATRTA